MQAQQRHAEELRPIQQYQHNQFIEFLKKIKDELGISKDTDVQFNPQDMTFVEVPPKPVQSPTTQDLSKKPV